LTFSQLIFVLLFNFSFDHLEVFVVKVSKNRLLDPQDMLQVWEVQIDADVIEIDKDAKRRKFLVKGPQAIFDVDLKGDVLNNAAVVHRLLVRLIEAGESKVDSL